MTEVDHAMMIRDAIAQGDMRQLDASLRQHPELIHHPYDGWSWMHHAALHQHAMIELMGVEVSSLRRPEAQVFPLLIRHGLSINARDDLGYTALDMAISRSVNVHVIEALLENGADPNRFSRNKPAIHRVISTSTDEHACSVIPVLIRHGADPNGLDTDGLAPLHHCISWNKFDISTVLLSHGASVKPRGDEYPDIFEYARDVRNHAFAQRLQAWIDASKALDVISASSASTPSVQPLP